MPSSTQATIQALRAAAHPAQPGPWPSNALVADLGAARIALIGEATHGTADFYALRAQITRRLIREQGFRAVAIEGDWPDAWRVNGYVRGSPQDANAEAALEGFTRFPAWMWRNTEVASFVAWLRQWNAQHPASEDRVGFYGLDMYSLRTSMAAVLDWLARTDREAWARARASYACFDRFEGDVRHYGLLSATGRERSCEAEVLDILLELQARRASAAETSAFDEAESLFNSEQNALLVVNAERYYRAILHGQVTSWNLRDQHMAGALAASVNHLDRPDRPARIVVWAHNSHVGDARATELGDAGELNLGQLARERWPGACRLVGMTTYDGEVMAADGWDMPQRRKTVTPALPGSLESLLHGCCGHARFELQVQGAVRQHLQTARLERAIGVVYLPQTERQSHYFHARVGEQFDWLIHLDRTRALQPLDTTQGVGALDELPSTFPEGI